MTKDELISKINKLKEKARKWDELQERIGQAQTMLREAQEATQLNLSTPWYAQGIQDTLNILGIIDLDN